MENNCIPKSVALELTYNCNNKCIFCSCPWETDRYIKEKELSTTEWKQLIDRLSEFGIESITLTGGEVLLRKDITELIEYIGNKKEFKYKRIITNGILLNDQILDMLKKYDFAISISMPGAQTYFKHTQNSNYENVLYWINKSKEYGLSVTTNVTVTKLNMHELYENLALPLINGSDTLLINRFLPGGRGLKYRNELELSIEQINNMLDIAEKVLTTAKRKGSVGTELPYCAIIDPAKYKKLHIGYICSASKDFFVVDPSGYIRACNHSEKRLGKINDFLENTYWLKFKNRDYIPEKCVKCKYVSYCDGGCREAANIYSGSLDGEDPCWSVK